MSVKYSTKCIKSINVERCFTNHCCYVKILFVSRIIVKLYFSVSENLQSNNVVFLVFVNCMCCILTHHYSESSISEIPKFFGY